MTETQFSHKLQFLFEPHRYKVLYGGRGGGKSHGMAKALLIIGARERHRILCTREFQTSIKDSVHKALGDLIDEMGLGGFYRVGQTRIVGVNGTEFIFAGLRHNVDSIKSTEGVTIAWVEEAQVVSEDSWKILTPTVRKKGSEIWVSFNPDSESDPTYKRFIANPPPGARAVELGWQDNPWISDELLVEKDHLYAVDADAAAWVWGGKTRTISKALVLHGKVVVETFEPQGDWDGPYQGADWGFAEDPTALVRCWIRDSGDLHDRAGPMPEEQDADGDEPPPNRRQDLYVEYEAYGLGVEITDTPRLFDTVPGARRFVTRADSARPETISHMQANGYPLMEAAKKGPGSVEDGVAHLRGYSRIVIHPRCKHAIEESRLWSYKKNKAGDVLPILIDKHDHCMDSIRYALEPVMRRRVGFAFV